MGDLWLQVVPSRNADVAILSADIDQKTRDRGHRRVHEECSQSDPHNPLRHDAVAMLNLQRSAASPEAMPSFANRCA